MDDIKLAKVESVRMIDRYNTKNPTVGTLYLTATHLIFVEPESNKETWILHMHVASIEKLPLSTTGSPLLIRCKTFLSVTFVIPKDSECHDVYTSLLKLFQPVSINKLYCFNYQPAKDDYPKSAGWDFFKLEAEFKHLLVPNDNWTLCSMNEKYELCDTYPRQIYVPKEATTLMLISSSRFRSKGRLPALTYLHNNKASICRCSQPLSGFSARCLEDEQMLEAIRKTNTNTDYMYVVDTRPRINAMANRAAGKGYENEAFYENIKFHFLGIENIHVQRASLQKVLEACEQKSPTMSAFLNALESSGWLKHIRSILDTSSFIANAVDKGVSVVVHCSDGWDRTAQVCSLAQLMLNPYYRTIKGFQALIEKDWLAFGHKFSERCGHIQTDAKEVSPIFTQFLDCTWQLMSQRSEAFEFNERFLLILHDHVHSCQFGTFVGNCEKDRLDLKLAERTFSLWGFMANHLNEYINPLYKPNVDEAIKANLAPQCIKFWRGMYCRFESGIHPREPLGDLLLDSKEHTNSLEDHVQHLSKRIASFKSYISKSAKKLQDATSTNTTKVAKEVASTPNEINDNKYNYDKKLSELSAADDDHPLKANNMSFANLSLNAEQSSSPQTLPDEIESVAIDWKPMRNVTACSCSTPFDQFSKKTHCWRCGDIFCERCIDKNVSLPGHDSGKPVPVCRGCFRQMQKQSP
ncbi:myotubularin-related protein 6 isoform X2 [Drosophila guanche]|uniref:phosphatidylinositol-3,5-bisphosphate 3-phosphatase n=1 Tax=Drosophila guanche TaxID=7266 RepID=A0A3B0JUM0_DROGU|nr:myotubularin-related protein 6 isoform X2 [Drosophila guanche]SPP74768.1 blast:Myotubularin-related protein 8 [Drosophila guanche]